ncbi:MAG: IPT/TIG domain-containing protein, partial [Actinomycetota bacterium]
AVTGYNLYRATASGGQGPTPLATGVATTAYTDLAVQNGVTYYYKVSAVNGAAEGPQSNEAAATPSAPPVSSDLRVLGIDPRSGPVAGGTKVTVSGLGLEGATQINFSGAGVVDRTCGGAAGSGTAPCFAQESPTQITVYSPKAPDAMRAHVSVTTAKGRSEQTDADLFAYVQQAAPGPPPALPTSRGVAAPGTSTPPNLPSTTSPLSSGGLQGPPPLTAPATLNAPVGVPGSAPVQAPVFAQVQAPSPGQVPAASQPAGAVPGAAIDSNREVPAEAPAYKMVGYSKGSPPILHLLLAGAALALGGFAAERRATRSRQICGGCLEPAPIPAPKGAY